MLGFLICQSAVPDLQKIWSFEPTLEAKNEQMYEILLAIDSGISSTAIASFHDSEFWCFRRQHLKGLMAMKAKELSTWLWELSQPRLPFFFGFAWQCQAPVSQG